MPSLQLMINLDPAFQCMRRIRLGPLRTAPRVGGSGSGIRITSWIGRSQFNFTASISNQLAEELARFYRFACVVGSIDPSTPVDWGRIAHQSHFYEVSHLNKDFVEFTGLSPSE